MAPNSSILTGACGFQERVSSKRLFGTGVAIAAYGTDRHFHILLAGIEVLSSTLDPGQKHVGATLGATFWTRSET